MLDNKSKNGVLLGYRRQKGTICVYLLHREATNENPNMSRLSVRPLRFERPLLISIASERVRLTKICCGIFIYPEQL